MTESRRFTPPWDIEEHAQSCFIVRDNNGFKTGRCTYHGRLMTAIRLCTYAARRIAETRTEQAIEVGNIGKSQTAGRHLKCEFSVRHAQLAAQTSALAEAQ